MKPYLFVCAALVTSLAQGAVPADPWTLVPPFPTACYSNQDDFDEVIAKRIDLLTAEIDKQDKINSSIARVTPTRDSSGKVDPFAMAQQMSQNMMKNPQGAMRTTLTANESVQPGMQADQQQEEKDRAQKEKLAGLIARYEAAFHAATTTTEHFWFGSSEGRDRPLGDGVSHDGGAWMANVGTTDKQYAAMVAYSRKVDQVYASQICPQ